MTTRETAATDQITGPRVGVLLIAGFGDNASMYDSLSGTPLAKKCRLIPLDLPGFGAAPMKTKTTLQSLADCVHRQAKEQTASVIVAHSVASIIASLAAARPDSSISQIVSLEGNLTEEDAYFSGTAADYDEPYAFRHAFLARLHEMARNDQIIERYRKIVEKADPKALWQLGCDARAFSNTHVPGEILMRSAKVSYIYNPENCPENSLAWLAENALPSTILPDASHWPSIDQPGQLAEVIEQTVFS